MTASAAPLTGSQLVFVVAMTTNRVIGKNNTLPWQLPPDLKHFKSLTMGHPVIMGRKTRESIGRTLLGRTNIIVTRQPGYKADGGTTVHSLEEALAFCNRHHPDGEYFIIGGAELFRLALPLCQRIYLTEICKHIEGDTFFPVLNPQEWHEASRERHHYAGTDNEHDVLEYHFVVLERCQNHSSQT